MDTEPCSHFDFAAEVKVLRHEDTGGFTAEIEIHCTKCGEPFRFLGLPAGMLNGRPSCSVTGLMLIAPIEPQGVPQLASGARYEMPRIPERE